MYQWLSKYRKWIVYSFVLVFGFNLCAIRLRQMDYRTFSTDIDSQYEIEISTYPVGYPKDVGFNSMETSDTIYLQLFVIDKAEPWRLSSNESTPSIEVHSFVYQLDDDPKIELLRGFKKRLWLQGSLEDSTPIPFRSNSELNLYIDLTLNGVRYDIHGVMPATEQVVYLPTILKACR